MLEIDDVLYCKVRYSHGEPFLLASPLLFVMHASLTLVFSNCLHIINVIMLQMSMYHSKESCEVNVYR